MPAKAYQNIQDIKGGVMFLHNQNFSGSGIILDETGRTWTLNGSAYLDNSETVMGGHPMVFDGSSYIDTPATSNMSLYSTKYYIVDFWIKRNSNGAQNICGWRANDTTLSHISFYISFTSSDKVYYFFVEDISAGGNYFTLTSTNSITADGEWHHVAITSDNSRIKIFIDGIQEAERGQLGFNMAAVSYNFAIGRAGENTDTPFDGKIANFRYINNSLNTAFLSTIDTASLLYYYDNFTSSIDTYIHSYDPTANYGKSSDAYIGYYGAYASSLFKFDISSLSASSICDSSFLDLYLKSDFASASVIWSAYRLKRDWTNLESTWNTYASGLSWQTAGALGSNDIDTTPIGTSGSISATTTIGDRVRITLNKDEIQKFIDGTYTNYGFLVKPNPMVKGYSRWYVYTCDYNYAPTDLRKPKFVIVYDSPSYGGDDIYTKSLIHFDYTGDRLYFRDEIEDNSWESYYYNSGNPLSGSGAEISLNQYKFGDASGYFAGSAVGNWIETPTQFNFGSQDWTCDFWIRPNFDGIETSWTHRGLFGYDVDDYNFWSCEISGSATDNQRFRYIEKLSGSSVYAAIGSIMPLQEDVWQHVAFVKQGTNLKGYLSGTNYMNTTIGSSMRSFMNQIFKIGNVGTASMYRGYMDEFRLSIGIKRWTSNFTPPTAPYAPDEPPEEGISLYGQPFMYSSYPWI